MQYRRFGCSMGAVRALAAGGRQQKWSDLYQANSNSYEISVEVTGSPWTSFLGLLIRWSAVRIRPGEPLKENFSVYPDPTVRPTLVRTADRQQAGSTTGPQAQLDADASRGAAANNPSRGATKRRGPFRGH